LLHKYANETSAWFVMITWLLNNTWPCKT